MENQLLYALVLTNQINKETDMFEREEFKKLCEEHKILDLEAYWEFDRVWKAMLDLICKDEQTFNGFIDYMKTEMTADEYIVLSAIYDKIAEKHPLVDFIEAYNGLALKYPEETKNYQIDNFIIDAETSFKISLEEANKKIDSFLFMKVVGIYYNFHLLKII